MSTRFTQRYMQYQEHIDLLIKDLAALYSCSCRPLIKVTKEGEFIQTGIEEWVSKNAEETYHLLQRNLLALVREQADLNRKLTPDDLISGKEVDEIILKNIHENLKFFIKEGLKNNEQYSEGS